MDFKNRFVIGNFLKILAKTKCQNASFAQKSQISLACTLNRSRFLWP